MEVVFEQRFKREYLQLRKAYPWLGEELKEVVAAIVETGEVPSAYNPHELTNPGGNYTGYWDFHLSDGAMDVVVIYVQHMTNPSVRFVRIGSHEDLFGGALL